MSFLVIALVFWYGSVLVANGEATTFQFFVGLMVRASIVAFCDTIELIQTTEYNLWSYPSWECLPIRPRHVFCA